jgi:GTP-binding protein
MSERDPIPAEHGPLVAIVGRPNVGKSTLFNRLCGGRDAIVEDEPGVTRDRRYGQAEWAGYLFRVIDTGGLDFETAKATAGSQTEAARAQLARGIIDQAMRAVDEAQLVVFVIDAKSGLVPEDLDVAERLRKVGKPILWVANKVDRAADEPAMHDLYRLGGDRVFGISAEHGRNVADLCDAIVEALPDAPRVNEIEEEPDETRPIKLALVGRPNAGKSSLVNRILGEERMLVDATAGTTRDALDTPVEVGGRRYILIDTAGIRRKARIDAAMEKIAVAMAEKAIARADVCVLVVDAKEGLAEQDAKIAGLCEEHGRALVILFNKLDLLEAEGSSKAEAARKKLHEDLDRQLQFVPWAKAVFASAKTGKGMQRVLDAVQKAYAGYTRRVPTGELNRWFEGIVEKHPPSVFRGKPIKLYFIQQPQARPPTFLLSVNYPEGVHFSYRRYLANQLRDSFGLEGTPVRIVCKARGEKKGDGTRESTRGRRGR